MFACARAPRARCRSLWKKRRGTEGLEPGFEGDISVVEVYVISQYACTFSSSKTSIVEWYTCSCAAELSFKDLKKSGEEGITGVRGGYLSRGARKVLPGYEYKYFSNVSPFLAFL